MRKSITSLVRPSILRLKPYRSARSLATEGRVFLDANELSEAPTLNSGLPCEQDLNRYPMPQPPDLLRNFAEIYGVSPERILLGRGSDEAIDLLTRTFCEPEIDEILITPPTYGMYEVSAAIQNVAINEVPLLAGEFDWQLDLNGLKLQLTGGRTKLVFICSPNNPTGTAFPLKQLREICEAAMESLVIVDEAYGEFSSGGSAIGLLDEFPNLVVLRTLSKAWGLAGLRCGVAIGSPEVIALLQKVRAPYPLARPVIDLALEALQPKGRRAMEASVAVVLEERERLHSQLAALPVVERIYPSSANFLLVQFSDERAIMSATGASGLIVRSRHAEPGLQNCVRITVGNREENDFLLQILQKVPCA